MGGSNGIRGGAVLHIKAISSGVKPYAALTKSLICRSRVAASAARGWSGSMLRACSSRRVLRPAAVNGLLLPRLFFTSATKLSASRVKGSASFRFGLSMANSTRSQSKSPRRDCCWLPIISTTLFPFVSASERRRSSGRAIGISSILYTTVARASSFMCGRKRKLCHHINGEFIAIDGGGLAGGVTPTGAIPALPTEGR